jgi:A/G-specific adenine glycosylase
MSRAASTEPLLAWGDAVRRDLPWRHTRDPWAILVSEVMLQQTQVARVIPKWTEFLRRWPSPGAAASAQFADIMEVWTGLGYPRRARALHDTAKVVTAEHAGVFPDRLDALLALPGIGPYTARAVLTFAFEQDVGVVDTNIARVLARRSGGRLTPRAAQDAADAFVAADTGWRHNQSLMDLGAMLCRPTPDCDPCPLRPACAWAATGWPEPDPAVGSAGVSGRQAKFEGSDRQGRGRLLRAVAAGPVLVADLAETMGWPDDALRAHRVAKALATEGFLERIDDAYVLAD